MKRKSLILALISSSTVAVLTLSILFGIGRTKKLSSRTNANEPVYTATLNSTIFSMSGLTENYQQSVKQSFGESLPLVMNYSLAKKDASGNLVLAPSGRIFNYDSSATYKGRITNIKSVTATYSGGSLFLQEGLAGNYENYGKKVALTSGTPIDIVSSPNYVMISNASAETTITSLSVEYTCSVASWELERLGDTYNGKSQEGNTFTLTRNGSNVSVAGQTGTIALDNSGNFTITLADGAIVYTGSVSEDYHTLSISGKSGAGAAAAPTLSELNRVYVMDDFESYLDRGHGYTAGPETSLFEASNLRGAYYVDAGSSCYNVLSSGTWILSSDFKLLDDSKNYLNLCTGLAHGGSKSMLLQGQKKGWVRAWSREAFDQNQHYNFGRGNRLSFWAYSGRNNSDGTGTNASNVTLRAQVYYQNFVLDNTNRNSSSMGTGTKDFTINSGSDWTKCTINLDPTRSVYAINIMINNSGISTDYVFMPIDDITIYTEPVYQPTKKFNEDTTHITKSYHGTATIKTQKTFITTMDYTVKVGLGANGYTFAYAGADMQPTSHTIVGDQLTIATTGQFSVPDEYKSYFNEESYTFGSWVGTFNNDKTQITINKADISGTITDILNSATITLVEDTVLVNGTQSTAALQAMFSNESGSSSWEAYTADNRIVQSNEYYIEGNSSVRMNPNGTTRTRMFINPTLAQAQSLAIESVAFWVYIPAGNNYEIQAYSYDNYNPTSGTYKMLTQKLYKADGTGISAGWNYVNCGIEKTHNKNIAIGVFTNPGSQPVIIDYVTYF